MNALLWLLLVGAFMLWGAAMAVVVVLQRRSPAATIAWLLVLALLPLAGWLIYRLIGPLRLERRKARRRVTRKLVEEATGALWEIEHSAPTHHREQLARVAIAAGEAPPLRADSIDLFTEGQVKYGALAEAIEAAKHHVHLEYYIWENDQIGRRLRDQLATRARAGVEVRVIIDGTGSLHARGQFFRPLRDAGAMVAWFNPVSLFHIRRRRADFRSHRKIMVCDGRVGFLGGINVADTETAEFSGDQAWRDTHVRFEGSAVRVLQRVFAEDWFYAADAELPSTEAYFPVPTTTGGEIVQIVASGPDFDAFAIHKVFFAAINLAESRLWLTTPYFVPDDAILSALVSAAMRGVDVRVIAPARSDSRLVDLAARSYFPDMLAAGARIYEYQPRFVHAKTFVIDDDIAIIGTANLDNRSFRLDFEVAAVIYGTTMNARLDAVFQADLAHCREICRSTEPQPFWPRLGQAGARLFSPLL
ncbi:MAG: cardiolipin synthase [Deltaproteobacteria bacterium]|nr:MAG: cardiolipin synthase [Deltaproteobacteria bacterium]